MAEKDYSATPLWKKLGIKEGAAVALVGAPAGFQRSLAPLPSGVRVAARLTKGPHDVIVVFVNNGPDLAKRFSALARSLDPTGGLWVAYPKKSSGVATDLTFEAVQRTGLDAGLVDNKSCAIDEVWSGVRFVYRLKDRPFGQ